MQIVINIDENVYTRLFDNGIQDNEIAIDDICEMARALRRGKSLPKGHGRLIDADDLDITSITTGDYSGNEVLDIVLKEDVDKAPTIIEADKTVSEADT